jgi:hypothetical protein
VRTDLRRGAAVGRAAPPTSGTLPLSARVVGAALVLATGWIHLHLWLDGYQDIRWIGPLFFANVIVAVLGGVALLLAPDRWVPGVALLAGLFEGGSLVTLLLSLTVGLLGFTEAWSAPLVVPTILIEGAGLLFLAGFGAMQLRTSRQHGLRGRPWPG